MSVKPPLFDIFETYFLPLGKELRPAFMGLLQGLLPGLEEGSEFFERGNNIIERFSLAVEHEFFYTCLWRVLIQAPSVRHFGTAFILNHFNKRRPISAQAYFFGTSTQILMKSLRCLLGDKVVLVQRDVLDFVILALPVHVVATTSQDHPLGGRVTHREMRDLLAAALTVLLKKDASLNRRLFIWLLGSQPVESADASQHTATTVSRAVLVSESAVVESETALHVQYFKKFGLPMLVEAVQHILQNTLASPLSVNQPTAHWSGSFRPFRLIAGLLNRAEIGAHLVDHVLVDFIYFTMNMYQRLRHPRCDGDTGSPDVVSQPGHRSPGDHPALPQLAIDMLTQYQSLSLNQPDAIGCHDRTDPARGRRAHSNSPSRRSLIDPATNSLASLTHSSVSSPPTAGLTHKDEFMREAELFFSNLESAFLWPFLETHLVRLLSPEPPDSQHTRHQGGTSAVGCLCNWIAAVRFLVNHLPIDTYPDVRGCYLPRMISSMTQVLAANLEKLKLPEIADAVDLLSVLIGHSNEHMISVFDQSLAEVTRTNSVPQTPASASYLKLHGARENVAVLFASVVGDVRRLLGAFFKHFLIPPTLQVADTKDLASLKLANADLIHLERAFHALPSARLEDRAIVIDLFAQICRLVVEMCNVTLIKPQSIEEIDFDVLFLSGGQKGGDFGFAQWLACLITGGALSADFDLKAICLNTLLDLVHASTSIHGWRCETAHESSRDSAFLLLLPVLSSEVLTDLVRQLDFFPIVGVSLWFFLDNPAYLEDAAALLIRLLTIAPNQKNTRDGGPTYCAGEIVEDFIVNQMLSADPNHRAEAHRRFALLWQLLRRRPSQNGQFAEDSTTQDSPAAAAAPSFCVPGWRRSAMGLPPVSCEAADVTTSFNRCLLILLDSLDNAGRAKKPQSPLLESMDALSPVWTETDHLEVQQVTLTWLSTALLTGQVGRIVAPLFATLLHPSTTKTSLLAIREKQRFQRHLRRQLLRRHNNEDDSMHLTQEDTCGDMPPSDSTDSDLSDRDNDNNSDGDEEEEEEGKKKFLNAVPQPDKNVYGELPSSELHFYLSSSPQQLEALLGPRRHPQRQRPSPEDVFDETYNPVDVMTNLQARACESTNCEPLSEQERFTVNRARRAAIQELLTDLLSPSAADTDTREEMLPRPVNISSFSRIVKSAIRVLPIHEHLLVYLHHFDFNQVIYALSRLRALLESDFGSQFVEALAKTPTAARQPASSSITNGASEPTPMPKILGTSLVDLLVRHYRCLFAGGDVFARHSTMEELEFILHSRMPSLLDVLIFVCVTFLCSLVPQTLPDLIPHDSTTSATTSPPSATIHIRLVASEVLHLLAKILALPDADRQLGADSPEKLSNLVPPSPWTRAVVLRSGLPQAVIHCLATSVEMSHLSVPASLRSDRPLCLRLLQANGYAAACGDGRTVHLASQRAELDALLNLTLSLLQLTRSPLRQDPSKADSTSSPAATPLTSRRSKAVHDTILRRKAQSTSITSKGDSSRAATGGLPWCSRSVTVSPESTVTKMLSPEYHSAALLPVLSRCKFFPSIQEQTGHLAAQPLILNTLKLAISPDGCVDLHPIWFRFLLNSLLYWGSATAYVINLVVTQLSGSLQSLTEPFCHGFVNHAVLDRTPPSYPADYTLQVLACLQGVAHAFLLPPAPTGKSGSAVTRHSTSPQMPTNHRSRHVVVGGSPSLSSSRDQTLKTSNACGMPEVAAGAREIATTLQAVSGNAVTEYPSIDATLQQFWSSSAGSSPSASKVYSLLMPVLTSFRPELEWVRGRVELAHVLPKLMASLAFLWLAIAQSPWPTNQFGRPPIRWRPQHPNQNPLNPDGEWDSSEGGSGVRLRCSFEWLTAMASLGHKETVRGAIIRLLEPIASTYPALFFTAVARVWPEHDATNVDLLHWLLSSSGPRNRTAGPPLTPIQCSLLGLIGGLPGPFLLNHERSEPGNQYLTLSMPSEMAGRVVVALLDPSMAIRTFRSLIMHPPSSIPRAFTLDRLSEPATASSQPTDPLFRPHVLQSALLHLLYAWIATTGGVGACFHLAHVQNFLKDVSSTLTVSAGLVPPLGSVPMTSPISLFLLVKIFNEIIITLSNKDEKRDQKDLQEICQRLLEATAAIASKALQQATWFRRGLQVRSVGPSMIHSSASSTDIDSNQLGSGTPDPMRSSTSDLSFLETRAHSNSAAAITVDLQESMTSDLRGPSTLYPQADHTVLALEILAEHMALFLDVVYRSDEKDRVPAVLSSGVFPNILPFLKSHVISNSNHLCAASQVLATLSSYQFTRRAWRRDIFELFIDPNFFQMPPRALYSWCTLVDNLMTQEKNTFKEVLTRLTVSQGSGLNIFSSKEAEFEQRAAHMKKINFIVFASEWDQYTRSVSEILERLTDNLRAPTDTNIPILSQVFLCSRVLIARISPASLASLWQIVLPELVKVLKTFADRCNGCSKKNVPLNLAGLNSIGQCDLSLLLSASKLLATMLLLPESKVPQLLFHRWVFVNRWLPGACSTANDNTHRPIVAQIASGLISIYQKAGCLYTTQLLAPTAACYYILATTKGPSFERLELFFRSLGEERGPDGEVCVEESDEASSANLNQFLTASLFTEFLEPMVSSKQ